MKTSRLIGAVLAIILYANFSACSSDPIVPEVTVEMGKEDYFAKNMDFDSSAGEKTFSFTSNVEWSVSVASTMNGETWCTVTPNSGKDGNNTIRVKVQENTGYDDRNVVLTLTAGSTLTKTITVTQKQKDAILLTTNKFEVEPQGGKINIEVKANVDYEAIISESCKSWISLVSKSRGLTTSNITFDIAETEEYDKREGEIIIKSGERSEIVHVYQAQKDTIIITQKTFNVAATGKNIDFKLSSNIDYKLTIPNEYSSWIKQNTQSRGLISDTYSFNITNNKANNAKQRKGYILVESKLRKDTISINQDAPIHIVKAGTLINYINKDSISEYKELVIIGNLNGDDIYIIRKMSTLEYLDIENVNIVEGGDEYYRGSYENCHTKSDIITPKMFFMSPLKRIILPKNITEIQNSAFLRANNLEEIIIPNTVKRILVNAFEQCIELRNVTLSENLEYLEVSSFGTCLKLKKITIPKSMKHLDNYVFAGTPLEEIHIQAFPSTLTQIEDNVFGNDNVTYDNATLYIPKGTKDAYWLTDLGRFKNIIEE